MIQSLKISEGLQKLLSQPTDPTLIRTRSQSGTTLSYITGYAVVRKLNAAFGYCWNWHVDSAWLENIEGAKPGQVCHVLGTLTAMVKDDDGNIIALSKQAYGSKVAVLKMGAQDNQNLYKVASTDALKKAASMFGIAADLYLTEEEQEFLSMEEQSPWDDATINQYKTEWAYIQKFQEEYEVSDEELNGLVAEFTDGNVKSILLIKPESLKEFIEYIENLIKTQGAE